MRLYVRFAVILSILAKFPLTGGNSMQTWIELCQKARADPHNLVTKNIEKLFDLIIKASNQNPKVCRSP